MKQNDKEFNQAASCLSPADMPQSFAAELNDTGDVEFETSVFSLPDFRDAVEADAEKIEIAMSQPVDSGPAPARSPKDVVRNASKTVAGKKGSKLDKPAAREAAAGKPAIFATATSSPTLMDFDPQQLDELFQRMDQVIFEAEPEGSADEQPGTETINEHEPVVEHQPAESIDIPDASNSSPYGSANGHFSDSESSREAAVEDTEFDSDHLPDHAAFASAVARVKVEREYASDLGNGTQIVANLKNQAAACRLDCNSLIKSIEQRTSDVGPGVFLFCDVDAPLRAGRTAATVARELAVATGKRVLLIDSDLEFGALTKQIGLEKIPGTREMLRAMHPWSRLVASTDIENVDWLGSGTQKLRFTGPSNFVEGVWRNALLEMAEHYGYVLVSTGTAFDNSLNLWCTLCHGSCVTLDAEHSSRSIAKAAIREISFMGCRVLGCVPVIGRLQKTTDARKTA